MIFIQIMYSLLHFLDKVEDVLKIGDTLDVKYFGIDPKTRKPKVSRKALLKRPDRKNNS